MFLQVDLVIHIRNAHNHVNQYDIIYYQESEIQNKAKSILDIIFHHNIWEVTSGL